MNTKKYIRDIEKENEVAELWNSGAYSMSDIALRLSITRERVRQLLYRYKLEGNIVLSHNEWKEKRLQVRTEIIKCSIESYKFEITSYSQHHSCLVRRRVTSLGLLTKCEVCGWDKQIHALVVHHHNRNRKDNSIDNLIILCPNCHFTIHHSNNNFNTCSKGMIRKIGKNLADNNIRRESIKRNT